MAVAKADRQLEAHTREVLAPGEHLVAATRALAVGAFEGRLGIIGELLTGAVMQSLLTGESVRRAHRAGFPAAPRMVIGMTDRRLLVWKAALFSHKPVRFLGDVPLERVGSVSVQPAIDRRRVTFGFVDAAPVSVTAYRRDQPERFAENFHRRLVAAPVIVATSVSAEPAPSPAPVDLPAAPAASSPAPALAAAAPIVAPAAPIVTPAQGSLSAPAFPPPPPLAPGRPPRPAAHSWASALPPATQSSPSASPEVKASDQRRCIQCGTTNPGSSVFCWRCFVPFAEQSLPRPATVPPPQSSAAPVRLPGALDGAVHPTLSWGAVPAPIKTKYRGGLVTKVAIAGMVALVAFVAYGSAQAAWARHTRKHVVVPASIAGMGRIDNPQLQPYVRQLEALAQQNGITGKAAFYGFSGAARFYFAAFEYRRSPNQSPDDIFGDFSRGYASAGQASIDLRTKTMETTEEATFICARVRGAARGSLCMWTDRDTVGFVQTIRQGIKPTHDLTAVVRFSVQG